MPATRGQTSAPLDVYVVCLPGLEPLVVAELVALGVPRPRPGRGGVSARMTLRQLYAANLHLRTATRLVVRFAEFTATTFAELESVARTLAWDDWVLPGWPVTFRVTSHRSALHHTDAIAERLHRAADRPPPVDGDDRDVALLVVRVDRDRFSLSVDSSGEPLHKRGWRVEVAKAPLRETLAAALLLGTGWDGSTPLVDPFCGSGTIPIEAALLARRRAPGAGRGFAFADWPTFRPGTWASVTGEAIDLERPGGSVPIVAADRDAGAVAAVQANAERAEIDDDVEVRLASVSDLAPPAGGAVGSVLTNPPYGVRIGGGELRNLYARAGQVLGQRFAGWRVGMLVADERLAGHAGLALEPVLRTTNGGIDVTLLAGRAGVARRQRPPRARRDRRGPAPR